MLVLISKMIKQEPMLYQELNSEFLALLDQHLEEVDGGARDMQELADYQRTEPMLNVLLRSLHALFL